MIATRNYTSARYGSKPEPVKQRYSVVVGCACVFGNEYLLTGGGRHVYERIQRGAFDDALACPADILLCIDHDLTRELGRRSDGSLRLWQNGEGLMFSCVLSDAHRTARTAVEDVRSGRLWGCSFSPRHEWIYDHEYSEHGRRRTVRRIAELREICLASTSADGKRPANPKTWARLLYVDAFNTDLAHGWARLQLAERSL